MIFEENDFFKCESFVIDHEIEVHIECSGSWFDLIEPKELITKSKNIIKWNVE